MGFTLNLCIRLGLGVVSYWLFGFSFVIGLHCLLSCLLLDLFVGYSVCLLTLVFLGCFCLVICLHGLWFCTCCE